MSKFESPNASIADTDNNNVIKTNTNSFNRKSTQNLSGRSGSGSGKLISGKSGSVVTISALDYGLVSKAPTPPPMPTVQHNPRGHQSVTYFPAVLNSAALGANPEMAEKRRVSIVNGSLGKHSMSSNINIITAPDKPILPGIYK